MPNKSPFVVGIHDHFPSDFFAARQDESKRLVVSVEEQQESVGVDGFSLRIADIVGGSANHRAETFAVSVFPILVVHLGSRRIEPHDIFYFQSADSSDLKIFRTAKDRMLSPETDELFSEIEKAFGLLVPAPIEPVERIILTIGIVVSQLGPGEFVPGIDHRYSLRQKQSSHQIAPLPSAESIYFRFVRRAFGPAVPGIIIVVPVPVFFAVRLVVLVVVRNQVVQREAIVGGNKLD